MNMPKLPVETTPFLWGAAAGAIALAIIGFSWGGWVTGSTAEQLASTRVDAAIVASLAPICVTQFQKGPEAMGRLAKLKEINSWEQGEFVSKGGWATMPGSSKEPNRDVASACAETLVKLGA
jgi:pimeloyl-ACP methyl ester carboxylesterase